MVPGAPGLPGLHVPQAVVKVLGPGGDSVMLHPQDPVVQTVRVNPDRIESVTINNVCSQH